METNASVRGTEFDSISRDALILENPENEKSHNSAMALDLGSVSIGNTSNIGGNTFRGGKSIGGNFINNLISGVEVKAEGNNFGITQFDGIANRVRGVVDFEPRLNSSGTSLTTKLDVDVRDMETSEGVSGATVTVGGQNGAPLGGTIGAYVFQGVSFAPLTVRVSAPNYVDKFVAVDSPDSDVPVVVLLQRVATEGEGEGEGPPEPPIGVSNIAATLISDFGFVDTDFDGLLSESEVQAWLNVTAEDFASIDANNDGLLSFSELDRVTCSGGCCPQVQKDFVDGLKHRIGDIFLLGLTGLALLLGSRRGRAW